VTGQTGMRILRAIVAGERDVHALARLRDRRVKATEEEVARALEGTYREEHMFALTQALEAFENPHLRMRHRHDPHSGGCFLVAHRLR